MPYNMEPSPKTWKTAYGSSLKSNVDSKQNYTYYQSFKNQNNLQELCKTN